MSDWTQPVCHDCWDDANPDRPCNRAHTCGPDETCCRCGRPTTSGIYIRVDPETVPRRSDS